MEIFKKNPELSDSRILYEPDEEISLLSALNLKEFSIH